MAYTFRTVLVLVEFIVEDLVTCFYCASEHWRAILI